MKTATHHSAKVRTNAATGPTFPALEAVTRPAVDTAAAAFYLNRKPQTLRCWATYASGPLTPLRISGRLAWPVTDLRRLLGVA